ncbi:MAG: hypothetical protein V1754_14330 [Pseudomonadota bacterium]
MPNPKDIRDDLDHLLSKYLCRKPVRIPETAPDEPSDQTLLLYLEDKLEEAEKQQLTAQLEKHPYSQNRLEILKEALAETKIEDSPVPNSAVFANLVFSLSKGASQLLSFVRGTDFPIHLGAILDPVRGTTYTPTNSLHKFARNFGQWEAKIQVEHIPDHGLELRIELSQNSIHIPDARASLHCKGEIVESLKLRGGVAVFSDLLPAQYKLQIHQKEIPIGLIDIDVLEV